MQNTTIKILVADDHKLFRRGIVRLLADHSNFYVISETENGRELIDEYFNVYPDIILVDIAMPIMTGLEAVEIIREKDPEAKALFISMFDNDEYIYKVLKCGGMGLLNKNIMEGELIYAIEQIYNNKKYFRGKQTEEELEKLVKEFESNQKELTIQDSDISFREQQILRFLNQGLNSKEMAEKLNLSKKTIDFYRSSIMRRFNLKSTTDLIRFSINYFENKN
jgi:DNA-binding NarL/FixJ family response regulator